MTCISSYTHLITPATKYKNDFWYSGKIRFIEPQGINGTCAGCPQQRYIPGEAGNAQGRHRVDIVEGSCGYRARGISIRGKFVLSIGQAKISTPALSYFQVGGMKHDQGRYAKGALCGSTRPASVVRPSIRPSVRPSSVLRPSSTFSNDFSSKADSFHIPYIASIDGGNE